MSNKVLTDYQKEIRDELIKAILPFVDEDSLNDKILQTDNFPKDFMDWTKEEKLVWLNTNPEERHKIQITF